jgi:Fe-S-cluster containining protein
MRDQPLMDFPCTGCGECCRHVGTMLSNSLLDNTFTGELLKVFPYKANEKGHCEMLVNGQCSVYENRPLLCNVRLMTEHFYSDDPMGHYLDSAKVCNYMIEAAGLDPKYKIDIDQLKTIIDNGKF